jgi:hypothetical protein
VPLAAHGPAAELAGAAAAAPEVPALSAAADAPAGGGWTHAPPMAEVSEACAPHTPSLRLWRMEKELWRLGERLWALLWQQVPLLQQVL